jgi:hypothetical protein
MIPQAGMADKNKTYLKIWKRKNYIKISPKKNSQTDFGIVMNKGVWQRNWY